MKTWTWMAMGLCVAGATVALSQTPAPAQTQESGEVKTGIPGVVAAGTKVQFIKDGFDGTEGPITLPDGSLIFTETNANRITKIDKDGKTSTYLENANGSNALFFDSKGRLYSVQTTMPRVGILAPKGSEAVLADKFEGQPFSRPNDLTVDKKGGVYFTDPGPNPAAGQPVPAKPPLKTAVYYIRPNGQILRIVTDLQRPNGVTLSKDEKVFYLGDTWGEYVLAFDIQDDGSLKNRRNFAKIDSVQKTATGIVSGADGLLIDDADRLYVCSVTGVQVFDKTGKYLGTIPIPRQPQNIAFAGADKKTLYVVGRGAAYKIAMISQGFKGRAK
jgi:gluconolactonase